MAQDNSNYVWGRDGGYLVVTIPLVDTVMEIITIVATRACLVGGAPVETGQLSSAATPPPN